MTIIQKTVGGQTIDIKTGGIESFGTSTANTGFSLYGAATFNDGQMLKNVNVDAAIDPYFREGGDHDTSFAMKRIGNAWLIYAVQIDDALRVGALANYGVGIFGAALFGIIGLIIAAIGGGMIAGMGLFGLVLVIPGLGIAYWCFSRAYGLWSVTQAAAALRRPNASLHA